MDLEDWLLSQNPQFMKKMRKARQEGLLGNGKSTAEESFKKLDPPIPKRTPQKKIYDIEHKGKDDRSLKK